MFTLILSAVLAVIPSAIIDIQVSPSTPVPVGYVVPEASDTEADRIAAVNTHLTYGGQIYASGYVQLKASLLALGIRYFRDGPVTYSADTGPSGSINGEADLIAAGLKLDLLLNTSQPASYVAGIAGTTRPTLVEGPNELNCSSTTGDTSCSQSSGDGSWATTDSSFMASNYAAFHAAGYTVIAPSIAWVNLGSQPWVTLGNLTASSDNGNLHAYTSSNRPPETNQPAGGFTYTCPSYATMPFPAGVTTLSSVRTGSLYSEICSQQASSGSHPIDVTEYGFNSNYVDRTIAAGALPNTVLVDYMLRGWLYLGLQGQNISHVFVYQGADQPAPSDGFQAFGVLDLAAKIKPNGAALGNLIALYNDPGAVVAPTAIPLTFSGTSSYDFEKLSQKRDGTYILAMWRACEELNPSTHVTEACGSDSAVVNFGSQVPTSMLQVTPNGSNATGTGAFTYSTVTPSNYSGGTMAVTLTGTPSIFEFKFSGTPTPAPTITPNSTYTPNS